MKRQITQKLHFHCTTDIVKSLYEQIDILKGEVYFLREELREKSNLLKIIVTSKFHEAVDGFIQEKKQQKSLITTKEKECCTTDTDDKSSINNHTINNKESNNNNDNINIDNPTAARRLKSIIMAVKSATTKMIITIISISKKLLAISLLANPTATSKIITPITKTRDTQSAEMAVAVTPISLTSITIAKKSTSTVMMTTITSTMATKETELIVTPRTRKTKSVRQKNLLSSFEIASSKRLMVICLRVPSITDILPK